MQVLRKSLIWIFAASLGVCLVAVSVLEVYFPRTTKATNACVNNLRQIDNAKQQWGLEKGKSTNAVPTLQDLVPYLGRGDGDLSWLRCQNGGTYSIRSLGEDPSCTCGGMDARERRIRARWKAAERILGPVALASSVGLLIALLLLPAKRSPSHSRDTNELPLT